MFIYNKTLDDTIFVTFINKALDEMQDKQNGTFSSIPMEMGSTLFVKKENNKITGFFMNSYDWGQYGDDSIKNEWKKFISGFEYNE